ncbi:MAG: 50S ribosomal protein L13, partial [Candidatus Micrarchaeota archaeon]
DLFFRKVVRGMLSWKSSRGKDALGRFRAYIGVPKEFEGKAEKICELADIHKKHMTVDELCKALGWKG